MHRTLAASALFSSYSPTSAPSWGPGAWQDSKMWELVIYSNSFAYNGGGSGLKPPKSLVAKRAPTPLQAATDPTAPRHLHPFSPGPPPAGAVPVPGLHLSRTEL